MRTLRVELNTCGYPIMVGQNLLGRAGRVLSACGFDSAPIVVTNRRVLRLHGAALLHSLEQAFGSAFIIRIGDGERFKNHSTLLKIYQGLFRAHADRRSWILAFGGGVGGDIAGYAAATFMRGIPFVMVPTTVLAQVDSSIGGKVGINAVQGKNLIGAFHQPSAVISDTDVLKTLPERELAAGLYEVVKCGAIRSEPLLHYLESNISRVLGCHAREMQHIVLESSRIKASIVARDEKESGLRMILNYGHTVGHAFEAATDYGRFKHGEAVAWGMIAALGFGRELGLLKPGESARLVRLILGIGQLPPLRGISFREVWKALIRDKKFRSGAIQMVLLTRPGKAEIRTDVDPSVLRRFLRKFLAGNGGGR